MIPTPELAELLQRTARRLESQHFFGIDLEYNWHNSSRCNCGLLVREALDMDEPQLRQHIYKDTWQRTAQTVFQAAQQKVSLHQYPGDPLQPAPDSTHCCSTGLNLGYVFNRMRDLGFDQPQDFQHLEFLSDPVILSRLQAQGITSLHHTHALHVALYMRALADSILETLRVQAQLQELTQLKQSLQGVPQPQPQSVQLT
jgi:hypothetical protein